MVSAASGVLAAAGAAVVIVGEMADRVETRRAGADGADGADGAKCPTAGPALLVAERAFAELATLFLAVKRLGTVVALDLVERMPPACPTVLGSLVPRLDVAEPPVDGSAWATPVPTAKTAQTPAVRAPAPSRAETSP